MAIRDLEQRADALANEAGRLKHERNAHAARCAARLRETLATPAALALCFSAGMLVGHRPRGVARERPGRVEHEREAAAARLVKGPLAAAALRLASAWVAGAAAGPETLSRSGRPTGPAAA